MTKSVDGFLTQDMAKIGHRTLTKGQSNEITDQFSIEFFSGKEVIKKKIERFKTEIERFYWRNEWGFFTQDKIGHRTLTKGQSNEITYQF